MRFIDDKVAYFKETGTSPQEVSFIWEGEGWYMEEKCNDDGDSYFRLTLAKTVINKKRSLAATLLEDAIAIEQAIE